MTVHVHRENKKGKGKLLGKIYLLYVSSRKTMPEVEGQQVPQTNKKKNRKQITTVSWNNVS